MLCVFEQSVLTLALSTELGLMVMSPRVSRLGRGIFPEHPEIAFLRQTVHDQEWVQIPGAHLQPYARYKNTYDSGKVAVITYV